jgi:hypothetical protein
MCKVLLDFAAIINGSFTGFGLGRKTLQNICSYNLSLSKAGQRLRAEGILMPYLHKALSLAEILSSFINGNLSK